MLNEWHPALRDYAKVALLRKFTVTMAGVMWAGFLCKSGKIPFAKEKKRAAWLESERDFPLKGRKFPLTWHGPISFQGFSFWIKKTIPLLHAMCCNGHYKFIWKSSARPKFVILSSRFFAGKRSISDNEMEEFLAEEGKEQQEHDLATAGAVPGNYFNKRDPYAFGLGKRDPYAFGLGKRGGEYSFGLGRKRDPYAFGLGKRSNADAYSFGKKDDPYAFGLGKRNPYAFGLGKRDPYAFGLGKRDPYAFGLGKRDPYAFGLGKRDPYSFGLGKRSAT
jgi:hypothetical protein